MSAFDSKLKEHGLYPLRAKNVSVVTVAMGHRCNLLCNHCYVNGSPENSDEMPNTVLEKILGILGCNPQIVAVNITGGSPELSPHFRHFLASAAGLGKQVMMATNLTLYDEPGMKDLPEFLAAHRVMINASLPHYEKQGVDSIRGNGTYEKVIAAMKRLNGLGYGREKSGLLLNILFTPHEAVVSPDMQDLESVYRKRLLAMRQIVFNNLFTINNVVIGRFREQLSDADYHMYMKELEDHFNPAAVESAMCRTCVSFGFDGRIYDCDFCRVLGLPARVPQSSVEDFDCETWGNREIATNPTCFVCSAGAGIGCSELF
jgi:radical SAM/Cys-rich protein